jgi:hypothetical protein
VNITLDLLKFVSGQLRSWASGMDPMFEEREVLEDAADALDDARDLLEDLG